LIDLEIPAVNFSADQKNHEENKQNHDQGAKDISYKTIVHLSSPSSSRENGNNNPEDNDARDEAENFCECGHIAKCHAVRCFEFERDQQSYSSQGDEPSHAFPLGACSGIFILTGN
jgi:hypothetical protein